MDEVELEQLRQKLLREIQIDLALAGRGELPPVEEGEVAVRKIDSEGNESDHGSLGIPIPQSWKK